MRRRERPIANVRSFICRTSGPGLNTGPLPLKERQAAVVPSFFIRGVTWCSRSASLRSSTIRRTTIHTTSLITARASRRACLLVRLRLHPAFLRLGRAAISVFLFFFSGTWHSRCDSTKRRIAGRVSRPRKTQHDPTSRDRRPTDRELAGPANAPTRDRSWMTRRSSCEFPSSRNRRSLPCASQVGCERKISRDLAETSKGCSIDNLGLCSTGFRICFTLEDASVTFRCNCSLTNV